MSDEERETLDFYAEHYTIDGWTVARLNLTVFVPNARGESDEDALALVREILTGAGFDIRVIEGPRLDQSGVSRACGGDS